VANSISSCLLAGDQTILIDNVERPLGGELLCQVLTQSEVRLRVLGESKMVTTAPNALLLATGNNLTMMGDMGRRTQLCYLDPGCERPEQRVFDNHPHEMIVKDRVSYATARITILRAYVVAGRPEILLPLGSFKEWSDLIRSALVWLGEADPCDSMETVREEDPHLGAMKEVFTQWFQIISATPLTALSVIETATAMQPTESGYGNDGFLYPEFREALLMVAGEKGSINTRKLGKWLRDVKGRVVNGLRLVVDGQTGGVARWRLDDLGLNGKR
jgi:putative DNA primase/helicase